MDRLESIYVSIYASITNINLNRVLTSICGSFHVWTKSNMIPCVELLERRKRKRKVKIHYRSRTMIWCIEYESIVVYFTSLEMEIRSIILPIGKKYLVYTTSSRSERIASLSLYFKAHIPK